MILDGERTGRLTTDKILLDATSGNTGIAYAMIGALKGYKVKLCLPANASHERKQILKSLRRGDGVFRSRRRFRRSHPSLPRGLRSGSGRNISIPTSTTIRRTGRRITTGPAIELLEQTGGAITHFVACMGTSGTFMGTSRRLKQEIPSIQVHFRAAFLGLPWTGRVEAHADGDRARHLRCEAGR